MVMLFRSCLGLLAGMLAMTLLSGCAAMFSPDYHLAEIHGPKGITATDPDGNQLFIQQDYDQQFLHLPKFDTFVTFHYGAASKRVLMHRSYNSNTLLDYLLFVPNLYVDDATGAWREYDPVTVNIDSTGGADTTLQIPHPSFWENEERPRLLLSFGFGFPIENYTPDSEGVAHGEYSVGISFQHRIEIFYRGSAEGAFGEVIGPISSYPSADIQSLIFRYYPWHNVFVEGGPSLVSVTLDSAWWANNKESKHVAGLAAGLGWCGDFSYFDARYEFGIMPYQFFNLPSRQFQEFVMTFGLIFRI